MDGLGVTRFEFTLIGVLLRLVGRAFGVASYDDC